MEVKSELIQAQLQMITTAQEATVSKALSMTYFNIETKEILVGDGLGSFVRNKLANQHVLGDVRASTLNPLDFQTEMGDNTWVLSYGQSVVGSDWATLTRETNVPDMRGQFIRGANNGRVDGNENPEGTALRAFQAEQYKEHNHAGTTLQFDTGGIGSDVPCIKASSIGRNPTPVDIVNDANSGGLETRPNNITVNYFIKINR